MPWSAEHKQRSRSSILNAAGRLFRRHARTGVGVDGVAKEAGLTSGAFYGHFESKDVLFRETLKEGLDRLAAGVRRFREGSPGQVWLQLFAAFYLGREHRDDAGNGCALPTLSGDVARAGAEEREAFESGIEVVVAELEAGGLSRQEAWTVLSLALGGVTLSRAVSTRKTADEIAQAIEQAITQRNGTP